MRRRDSVRILRLASSWASRRNAVQSQPPHSFATGQGSRRRSGLNVTTRTSSALANPFFTSVRRTSATSPGKTFDAKIGNPSTRAMALPPATSSVASITISSPGCTAAFCDKTRRAMKVHEYQAKEILRRYGVPTPRGIVVANADEARQAAKELGGKVVVKAQIHAGGRGKGGGVKLAKTADEAADLAKKIIGMTLITHQTGPEGRLVQKVL